MIREPYWDYMGRRLRDERLTPVGDLVNKEDMFRREISEMQKQVHGLQMRIVKLSQQVYELKNKVSISEEDPNQMELKF